MEVFAAGRRAARLGAQCSPAPPPRRTLGSAAGPSARLAWIQKEREKEIEEEGSG